MSDKRALLVTGARALADFPEAVDWAEAKLAAVLSNGWTVLLTGGCPNSPDEWARRIAEHMSIPWVEYRLDGFRYGSDGKLRRWWPRNPHDPIGEPPHPQVRNGEMVRTLRAQKEAGWEIHTLALLAPWSTTRGAVTTLAMARKAGFTCVEESYPATQTAQPCACGKGMFREERVFRCRGCGAAVPR